MAWSPKEKPLTLEEAIDLARTELAPFWLGSKPMLAAVKEGERATAHPLDAEFAKSGWLIYLMDPLSFSGETSLLIAREWHRRYKDHELRTMFVYCSWNPTLFTAEAAAAAFAGIKMPGVMVLDKTGHLSEAFGVREVPAFVLFAEGKVQIASNGKNWSDEVEKKLQAYIRILDPGVPFVPPLELSGLLPNDVQRIELGSSHKGKSTSPKFPAPGFIEAGQPFLVGAFTGPRPETVATGSLHISGKWAQLPDRLITNDSTAELVFKSPASRFSIIAQTQSDKAAKIIVEVNDLSPYDAISLSDLSTDEDGSAVLRVLKPDLHHVLAALPSTHRVIRLRFPMADKVPVGIFTLLFGE